MPSRVKLTIVMLVPILLGSLLGTTLIWNWASSRTEARALHFAEALVAQVSQTVTDPLLQEDALSLNVLLSDLVKRGDVSYASVYSADNRLMAQAGRRTDALMIFNDDITFQNTSAGYVQLGMDKRDLYGPVTGVLGLAMTTWALIGLLVGTMSWFYGDLIYLWLGPRQNRSQQLDDEHPLPQASSASEPEPIAADQTILVVKIRPARQLDAHFETFMQAIALYGGEPEVTDGDDINVMFKRGEQLIKATCTARLLAALMERARGNNAVKSGLHVCAVDAEPGDLEKAIKHATYLASIAERQLLASKLIFNQSSEAGRVDFEAFHSSLTPDGEVYVLRALDEAHQQLIDKQADQLGRQLGKLIRS